MKFDRFKLTNVLLNDLSDPDRYLYNNISVVIIIPVLCKNYFSWEFLFLSEKFHIISKNISMIHLNLREAKKVLEKFEDFFS